MALLSLGSTPKCLSHSLPMMVFRTSLRRKILLQEEEKKTIHDLPLEIIWMIGGYLSDKDVYNASLVCSRWYSLLIGKWNLLKQRTDLQEKRKEFNYRKTYPSILLLNVQFEIYRTKFLAIRAKVNSQTIKKVGMVYTFDEWKTNHTALGQQVVAWQNGLHHNVKPEDLMWLILIHPAQVIGGNLQKMKCWFALFAEDESGNKVWDNNDGWNYEARGEKLSVAFQDWSFYA